MKFQVLVAIFALLLTQVICKPAESHEYDIVIPFASLLEMQTNITETLKKTVDDSVKITIDNLNSYNTYIKTSSDTSLKEHEKAVLDRVEHFKQQLALQQQKTGDENIIVNCIVDEGNLDSLAVEINNQVKRCAGVVLSEMTNVISDSINEAQTFMTVPETIGKDFQTCGMTAECLRKIVGDAISESLQIPPKVTALAAKIQQISLRTVVSIDSCAFDGLETITKSGMQIIQDVLLCINDELV